MIQAITFTLALADPGTFQLTVSSVGVDDETEAQVNAAILDGAQPVLSDHGYDVTGSDPDVELRVMVEHTEGDPIHLVSSVLVDAKGSVLAEAKEQVCMRCGVPELADLALQVLTPEHLNAARGAAAPAPPPPSVEPESRPTEPTPAKPIGPLGGVGIGLAGVGLGAAIAGGVLLHRGLVGGGPTQQDYRPAGLATLSVGLGALVVGHVLTAIDLGRRGERRTQARLEGLTLHF